MEKKWDWPIESYFYYKQNNITWRYLKSGFGGYEDKNTHYINTNLADYLKRFIQYTDRNSVSYQNGCIIISAYKDENSEDENKKNTEELSKEIKEQKLKYFRILGEYCENKGKSNENYVLKEAIYIPNQSGTTDEDFFNFAISLCEKYCLKRVLISLPNLKEFGYYDSTGKLEFSPDPQMIYDEEHLKEYFSALLEDRSKLTTEWLARRHPSSVFTAVAMVHNGETWY